MVNTAEAPGAGVDTSILNYPAHCCLQQIQSVLATGISRPCCDLLFWHENGTPISIPCMHTHPHAFMLSKYSPSVPLSVRRIQPRVNDIFRSIKIYGHA